MMNSRKLLLFFVCKMDQTSFGCRTDLKSSGLQKDFSSNHHLTRRLLQRYIHVAVYLTIIMDICFKFIFWNKQLKQQSKFNNLLSGPREFPCPVAKKYLFRYIQIIMPRKALVSEVDAVAAIETFFDHFQEGQYPAWSSCIWKQMSEYLNSKWTGENVYTNVTQNRRGIMETACSNKNVPFIPFNSRNNHSILDESGPGNSTTVNDGDSDYVFEEETAGLDYFEVWITPEQWKNMREPDVAYNDDRTYPILHRRVWTDVLALEIDRQMELPCAFVFDKSKIYESPESQHYMRITGACKSKECGNPLFCYLNKEPGDHNFHINIWTRDTLHDHHKKVERPLRGLRRQQVAQEAFAEGCANWRKQQAAAHTKFGGRLASHIPNLHVLHQAKKEFVDRKLGVKRSDGKDLVKTLEEMRNSARYHGFIHEIRRDKFYIAFSTPAQLHAYKQYCRTTKELSSVSIDGTGSIVRPLIHDDGSPSGHIFLYSVIINFNNTTLSIYDMLTESQDTDVISWWLKQWHKLGAPKPKQAVCDASRALLNGISQAFNYQTVKAYIETCFLYASGNPEYVYRSPIYTYLRLDVAHLMIMIRKWKCFEHMRHTMVRQFYQYCIALMIDCQTLNQFEEIFQLVCIVGVNEFQDSVIAKTGYTVLSARKKLEGYIANRNFNLNFDDNSNCDTEDTDQDDLQGVENGTSRIKSWIENLRKTAEITKLTGSEPNSFYFIDFIDRFMSLANEFPLWTAVAIPHVAGHAVTAFVEGHFNMVKHGALKNYSGLQRVDKFLKIILQDYCGGAAIIASKLKVSNQIDGPYPSPLRKPTIYLHREVENKMESSRSKIQSMEDSIIASSNINSLEWCSTSIADMNNACDMLASNCEDGIGNGEFNSKDTCHINRKGSDNKHPRSQIGVAKGKYFRPNPDIHHRHNLASNIQQSWLLRNGNIINTPARIDGLYYLAYNTCGFDSIIQILSASAMDDPEYMNVIQKSTNTTLQFVINFVKNGPRAITYKDRIVHLKNNFPLNISANYDNCSKLTSYSINLFDNLNMIWEKCFNSEPSAYYTHRCPECNIYTSSVSTLKLNHKIIGEGGFGGLWEALEFYRKQQISCNTPDCKQLCQVNITYNTQIFIELDVRPNLTFLTGMTCTLREFPVSLNLGDRQYRLAGVIAHLPGHYIAYNRRINNHWEMCNDTNTKIVHCTSNTLVEPHGVIYIALTNEEEITSEQNVSFSIETPVTSDPCTGESIGKVSSENKPSHMSVPECNDKLGIPRTQRFLDDSDTFTRDNWRNKEAASNVYFNTSFEEIEPNSDLDDHNHNVDISYECESVLLLRTGNVMPGVILDGAIFHLRETQIFDSIVHVLLCSALEDPEYMTSIKNSQNETLQFILHFVEIKLCEEIYKQRAVLLKTLYASSIFNQEQNSIVVYTIDVTKTLSQTWETCLHNEPSIYNVYECKLCGSYIVLMPVLTVDSNLIVRKGFTALNEALNFHQYLKKVKCQQDGCLQMCTVTGTPNFHICIDLDIRSNDRSRTRIQCKLQDFPKTLNLKGVPGQYRLKGIFSKNSNGIVAHCLRAEDRWELYDGYSTTIEISNCSEVIKPRGAIYIRS